MPDWITISDIIIGVAIALVPALVYIGMWIGSVNSDRSVFKEYIQEMRNETADLKQQSSETRLMMDEYGKRLDETRQMIAQNQQMIAQNQQMIAQTRQMIAQAREMILENGKQIALIAQQVEANTNQIKVNDNRILDISSRLPSHIDINQSPLGLSELGKNVSNELNAISWADEFVTNVQDEVRGKDAYEIQMFCMNYVMPDDRYTEEQRKVMRKVAYDNGLYVDEVRRVIGYELRDKLLSILLIDQS